MARARVFVDIDTQRDFIDPDGRLYVPGAVKLVSNLQRLTTYAVEHQIPILASADAHVPDDPEFRDFPPHCVCGTHGQQKIEATRLPEAPVLGPDQVDPDAVQKWRQSGSILLETRTLSVFENPNADVLVSASGDAEFVVYGVATDYCVKEAVLGLLDRGKQVTVVTDAIRGIVRDQEVDSIEEFCGRGARSQTTAEVCR